VATGGAIRVDGFDPDPTWTRWWRLVIAVPFRLRGIRRARNIDYWGDGNYRHKLDILTRRLVPAERAPVLVYIHGGGWVIGDKRQQGIPLMHELVQRGWVCVAINYRLSPRATWPSHIVDCKRAVAWVRQHIAEYGGDPDFIAVSGGSAGGHLASLLALTPDESEWQPGFEDLDASVDACLPFYGVYDMTGDPERSGAYGPGMLDLLERRVMKARRSDNPVLFEQASPDRRVTPSAPPMFVCHGTNDTLVPLAVGRHFVAQLRLLSQAPVAYVELPRAQHAFDVMASIRSRHTTMGAVRFLEGMRVRVNR
jgi:acetyl esterase/lipase